jgi:hypothetical protein
MIHWEANVLWPFIVMWAVGACLIVAAFVVELGVRRTAIAVLLFVVGIALMAGGVVAGRDRTGGVHGVRIDLPR